MIKKIERLKTMPKRTPLTMEALDILDTVERRGSFSKAAEELNKATSAVSYTIQKLEEDLDVTLFQRQGRRSVLTPAGRVLLDDGRLILNASRRLVDKTREVATGWEPRIGIAVESIADYPTIFKILDDFLNQHPSIELDLIESVLNGGWEALNTGSVDLLIGGKGPVPQNSGLRAVAFNMPRLVAVIASSHRLAEFANDRERVAMMLPEVRRVVTHDTAQTEVALSKGLSDEGQMFYVQNVDQKLHAIVSGIGIGHLPITRVQSLIDQGVLCVVNVPNEQFQEGFIAWKLANKGKGLASLTQLLERRLVGNSVG